MRWRPSTARTGVLKRVKTMKTENIWSVFPVIYIPVFQLVMGWVWLPLTRRDAPKAFMGSCFAGAMATSHAFFILSVSISSGVGGTL